MRRTHYLLLVVILFAFHVQSFAYGESTSSVQKDSRTTSSTEPTQKSTENHDEFDEIAGQLQGMKDVLENMRQDYEARLKEMQEKTEKIFQPTSTAEVPIAGAEEIRMKKEEYDAVVGKLQEIESSLENMETNYDSRFKNIQETYNTRLEEVQQKIAITPQFERPKLYVDHTSKRFPSGSNRKNALPPHGWSLILPTFIPLSNKHCHVSSARST